ncbi:zinc-ribbon domain-containing protein [Acidaminococcus timonensis]|jgi:predicted amidophosphoribosyltransferase|uniref:zinc-ribbon domain-containing protein n=1 Tax=Acidaminococcus timonensis TaxID=1871002 RepID=UPI003A5BC8E5
MVKFCPHCGKALEPGNRFCPSCGKEVEKIKSKTAAGAGRLHRPEGNLLLVQGTGSWQADSSY